MIKNIIDILTFEEYYNVSNNVDIAKGKYEYPTTLKGLWNNIKRKYYNG